jgi:pantoate--beta-alanine ligase
MQIAKTVNELNAFLEAHREKSIGFVPTMGALHKGHLTLIATAKAENDLSVCSVFVNPKQFNNSLDLERYPRNTEADTALLKQAECDLLFLPDYATIYPEEPVKRYDFGMLENTMEGHFRPDHFNGVALVVHRFFELIQPQRAYFGEKDFQQVAIVKQLVKQTSSAIEIRPCPTVRDVNGLAISSRNQLLNDQEKEKAALIYKWLTEARQLSSKQTVKEVKTYLENCFNNHPDFRLEYVEIVNTDTLQPITSWENNNGIVCCIAVYLNNVRLIDNLLF